MATDGYGNVLPSVVTPTLPRKELPSVGLAVRATTLVRKIVRETLDLDSGAVRYARQSRKCGRRLTDRARVSD